MEVKQKRTYRKRVRKTPKVGTVEWELWRLQEGEGYTVTRMLRVDEATEDKLRKLKSSAKSAMSNYFRKLRDDYGKDFTLSAYDVYDGNRKMFVVFAVATALANKPIETDAEQPKEESSDDYDL